MPIGTIGRPHGLSGEVRVFLDTTSSSAVVPGKSLVVELSGGETRTVHVRTVRAQGKCLVARLETIGDRNAAEGLRGAKLLLPRSDLPAPDEGEYYDADLVGLEARDADGVALGVVHQVEHPPANDVLVLRRLDGHFVDVPLVAAFVPSIDVEGGTVTLDLPEGLPSRKRP